MGCRQRVIFVQNKLWQLASCVTIATIPQEIVNLEVNRIASLGTKPGYGYLAA